MNFAAESISRLIVDVWKLRIIEDCPNGDYIKIIQIIKKKLVILKKKFFIFKNLTKYKKYLNLKKNLIKNYQI